MVRNKLKNKKRKAQNTHSTLYWNACFLIFFNLSFIYIYTDTCMVTKLIIASFMPVLNTTRFSPSQKRREAGQEQYCNINSKLI